MQREWSLQEQAIASVVEKRIEFGGQVYRPNSAQAFLEVKMCHSLPVLNTKRRGFTAATLANSFASARLQLVDFEHRLAFYLQGEKGVGDAITGTIADVEFADKAKAIELAAAGEAVPLRALLVLYRKAQRVEKTLSEIASGKISWRVSMECEYDLLQCSLWDGERFHEIGSKDSPLLAHIHPGGIDPINGKPTGLILGGQDGEVMFSGVALTKHPADKDCEIESVAASENVIVINPGWKSQEDWKQAVASDTRLAADDVAAYSGPDDEKLPENVKGKPKKAREQWVGVWNSTFNRARKDGHTVTEAEQMAFKMANGVMKRDMADEIVLDSEIAAKAWDTEDAPDGLFAYVPTEAKGKDGKKSLRKFPLASVEKKALDPAILRNALARLPQASLPSGAKAQVKARILAAIRRWNSGHPSEKITVSDKASSLTICQTSPDESGHMHDVLSDATIMPSGGHSHHLRTLYIDPEGPTVKGATGSHVKYDGQNYTEHAHTFEVGASVRSETAREPKPREEPAMKNGEMVKFLRDKAAQFKDTDEAQAKEFSEKADALEKERAAEDVEGVIAARITSGDLVPKAKHEGAVAEAKKAGRTELETELASKAKADQEKAESMKARLEKVKAAGIDPAFTLGKDKSIESVVASMPAGEDGEKAFAERLEEWAALRKATGQATASDKKTDTGSAVPLGGAGRKGERKAIGMI